MLAKLEFNLPEDEEEYRNAINGADYKLALEDMDNYLRGRLKYEELPEDVHKALQEARDKLLYLTNGASE